MIRRLLKFAIGCRHENYSWPAREKLPRGGHRTYVVCLDCSQQVPYVFGEGKLSRWREAMTAGCLFLVFSCGGHKPATEQKPAESVASISFTRLNSSGVEEIPQFKVCRKRGESQYASNAKFEVMCWSENRQRFSRIVILEQ